MCASSERPRRAAARLRRLLRQALWLLALALAAPAGADDIVVIVHRDNPHLVDLNYVQQLYVGAVRGWPDGGTALVLDQPDGSAAREAFSANVLRRSPANVRAVWAQNIFTGRGFPPRVASEDEVKRLVAANRRAIGYIRASELDASVRAIGRP